VFLALDEFAHFRSAKGSTSEDMYAAATPATIDFITKEKEHCTGDGEEIEEQEDMYAAATPVTIDFHHKKKRTLHGRMEKK